MSKFTNFGENKIADYFRGQGLSALPTQWRLAPLSAASDSAVTEVTGSGIVRFASVRNLTNWAGTQGAGSVLASSGSSKTTSNNVLIDCGTAAGSVGTVTHIGFFDNSSGGNCWMYVPLLTPIVTGAAVAIQVPIGDLSLLLGSAGGATDYLVNKLIDFIFRGQAYSFPSSTWLAALLSGGGEVGGGVNYSRVQLPSSMTDISGTQAAGSTSASSGTAGRISNNNALAFPEPSADWGAIDRLSVFDASSSGNELWRKALTATKSIGLARTLVFQANAIGFTID